MATSLHEAGIPCRRPHLLAGRRVDSGVAKPRKDHPPPDLWELGGSLLSPLSSTQPSVGSEMTQEAKQGVSCPLWPSSLQVPLLSDM